MILVFDPVVTQDSIWFTYISISPEHFTDTSNFITSRFNGKIFFILFSLLIWFQMDSPKSVNTINRYQSLEYEFAQETSCHGFKHVCSAKQLWTKAFWIIALLACFGILISQIAWLTLDYLKFEAVTEVKYTVSWTGCCVYFCLLLH